MTRLRTLRRARASRRRAASKYRRMRGGAAVVAEMLRDIKEDVKDDIDKSHLDKAVDTIKSSRLDSARADTGENMFMVAMRRIKSSSAKELSSVDKRVKKIMDGCVRDILPAFDRLVKESADVYEKKMAGMRKMKAALERFKQSESESMEILQKKMDSVKEEMSSAIVENKASRQKIIDAISGINGGDKIKDAFPNMAGGGVFSAISGFFSWLWDTFKFIISTIVSALYFLMALIITLSIAFLAFGTILGIIFLIKWVVYIDKHPLPSS